MIKNIFLSFLMIMICLPEIFSQSVRLIPYIEGLSSPTCFNADNNNRFYITQRGGTIVITDSAGNQEPELFLDISDRVKSDGQEQGLLGIALHPDFLDNGWFYVNYTGTGDSTHISRFNVDPSNHLKALASSEFKLMTIYQPFQNHNGGDLQFGPDLNLYIGLGDGGSAGDPGNRAQNKGELLGKILRINVNAGNPYAVPPDNPFVLDPLARPEIWSIGLRNPWRFSFDRQTGEMWIGDVGQGDREEIDMQPSGSTGGDNYGWRCYEGTVPFNTDGCSPQSDYVSPVFEYSHDAGPCSSVTGGYVYRGTLWTSFQGQYFFAEYCRDIIWSLSNSSGSWVADTGGIFTGNNFSSFGEDKYGELFISGLQSGKIYRITDSSATGTSDLLEAGIELFPNPFTDRFSIKSNGKTGTYSFNITDMSGRVCLTGALIQGENMIRTDNLSRGIYLLIIQNEKKIIVSRIVRK